MRNRDVLREVGGFEVDAEEVRWKVSLLID